MTYKNIYCTIHIQIRCTNQYGAFVQLIILIQCYIINNNQATPLSKRPEKAMAELRPGSRPQILTARRRPGVRPEIGIRHTAVNALLLSAYKPAEVLTHNINDALHVIVLMIE